MTKRLETGRWLIHFPENIDVEHGITAIGPVILVGESKLLLSQYLIAQNREDLVSEIEAEVENIAY